MAYDTADGYVVMYGGAEQASGTTLGTPLSDTWTYKSGVWTELFPTPSPPPRAAPEFVYDTLDGKLLLFGGDNLGGSIQSPSPAAVLHDTWTFSGGKWTQIKPSAWPPGRFGAPIVYDAIDGYVLMFGGFNFSSSGTLSIYSDLWSFKGSTWTQLPMQAGGAAGTPGAGRFQAMAYDPYDGYSVLYDNGASWYYVGGYWYQIASGAEPPEPDFTCGGSTQTNCIFGMAYDPMDRYIIFQTLVYGYPSTYAEQTWAYRSGNWLNVTTPSTEISEQENPAMTYDAQDGYILYFGGDNPQTVNDTWLFPGPLTVTVSSNRSSLDLNQSVTLTANPAGGYPSYSYTWTTPGNLGCPSSTSISIVCTPVSATGSPFSVSVTATDSAGTTSSPSTTSVKVYKDPSVGPPSPSIPTADIGTSVTFTASPSGGTGTFHYAWSGLPTGNGCASANLSAISCTPSQQTATYVAVTVKDTNGYVTSSSPSLFIVHSSPFVSLAVNRTNLDANEPLLFYANASGGTGVYTYTYNRLPSGCTTGNTSRLQCTPASTGTFTVNVTVTDTGGGKYTSVNQSFSVYPDPRITSYWFPMGGQVAYANESLSLGINYTGGIGPYSSCISGPPAWPAGCVSGLGGSNLTYSDYQPFVKAGVYPVKVNFTDSTRRTYAIQFNESVYYPILVSPPSILAVHQGVSTNASFSIYSMHGAIPMVWWLNDTTRGNPLCGPVPTSTYGAQQCSFTPTWNGTDKLNLSVQDALHSRLFVTFTYSVPSALRTLNLKATTGPNSATQGGTLPDEMGSPTTFSATWAGGSGAYTCTLTENGSVTLGTQGSSTPSCTLSYTWLHAAAYTVVLTVTDSLGGGGGSIGQSLFVDVISKTSILTFTPSFATVDVQANDNLSVTYMGGYPNYTFFWDFGNGDTRTTATPWVIYAWPHAGNYTASVTITDSLGLSSPTDSVSITVRNSPAVVSMSVNDGPISETGIANGATIQLPNGTMATFNITESGGVGSYTYTWTLDGAIVGNTTVAAHWSLQHLNMGPDGTYTLGATVTDSQGESSRWAITVDVVADAISSLNLTGVSQTVVAGTTGNLTVTYGGGFGPFTYRWVVQFPSSSTRTNTTVPWLEVPWSEVGKATVTVTVVDVLGAHATASVRVSVVDTLTSATLTPSLGAVDVGMWDNVSVTVVGGHAPYAYEWKVTTGGRTTWSNTTTPWLNRTWSDIGTVSISVTVTDEFGVKVSTTTSLTVNRDLTVGCAPTMSGVPMPGSSLTLTLSCVSGGTGALTYHWTVGNSTKVTSNGNLTTSLPLGTYQVSVNVADSLGKEVRSQTLTLGTFPPAVTNVTYQVLSIGQSGVVIHLSIELDLQATDSDGQVLQYRYALNTTALDSAAWILVDQKLVNLNLSSSADIVTVYFQVLDSMGRFSSPYQLPLNVSTLLQSQHPTNQNTTSSGMGWGEVFLLVIIAVMVAFLIVVTILQMRKKRGAKGESIANNGGPAPDDPVSNAILEHLRENPNEEEQAVVSAVMEKTGASPDSVLTTLSMLSSTHEITPTEIGDTTRYCARGAEDSQQSIDRLKRVTMTILGTVDKHGTVTGAKLVEVLVPFHLSESEITTTLRTLQAEGSVRIDWGDSFREHRIHKILKVDYPPSNGTGDIEVDETAMFPMADAIGVGRDTDRDQEN